MNTLPSEYLPDSALPPQISWESLSQPVDMTNNILGNRFLERCQSMLLFGPAGCGKSVAALQAQVEWSAGLKGMHIEPARPLKIVIIQTEDSENDYREMLPAILESSQFTAEKIKLVRENLIILEQTAGGTPQILATIINEAVKKYSPNMVSVNPLLAFCAGDPTRELGNLLYQHIDPVLKKHRLSFFGIHHTPKMNNKDTSGYGAHDHQYLAAGDARVANWPRAMIQIEPIADGVYCFRAAKRGNRTGWTWDLKPTNERYYRWSKTSVRWEDAMPEEVKEAAEKTPYHRLLDILPPPDAPGISRERLRDLARGKGFSKHWTDDSLKLCIEDEMVEIVKSQTKNNRLASLFRRTK